MFNIDDYINNKNIGIEILNNLRISYFLNEEKYDNSLLGYIQEVEPDLLKNNMNKIIEFISNFNENDLKLLSIEYGELSSEDNWLEEIISIVHYSIVYPDLFDIYEWSDDFDGSYKPSKLKDPFYSFDELKNLLYLKNVLKVNEDVFFNNLRPIIYDYATYSIGSYNNDLREEFMDFYDDVIVDYLKKNNKEDNKDNKNYLIIEELQIFKQNYLKYENRKIILDLIKDHLDNNELKIEYVKMYSENNIILDNIPKKYRDIKIINEEINKLSIA